MCVRVSTFATAYIPLFISDCLVPSCSCPFFCSIPLFQVFICDIFTHTHIFINPQKHWQPNPVSLWMSVPSVLWPASWRQPQIILSPLFPWPSLTDWLQCSETRQDHSTLAFVWLNIYFVFVQNCLYLCFCQLSQPFIDRSTIQYSRILATIWGHCWCVQHVKQHNEIILSLEHWGIHKSWSALYSAIDIQVVYPILWLKTLQEHKDPQKAFRTLLSE